jgi:hypothetical protein
LEEQLKGWCGWQRVTLEIGKKSLVRLEQWKLLFTNISNPSLLAGYSSQREITV